MIICLKLYQCCTGLLPSLKGMNRNLEMCKFHYLDRIHPHILLQLWQVNVHGSFYRSTIHTYFTLISFPPMWTCAVSVWIQTCPFIQTETVHTQCCVMWNTHACMVTARTSVPHLDCMCCHSIPPYRHMCLGLCTLH